MAGSAGLDDLGVDTPEGRTPIDKLRHRVLVRPPDDQSQPTGTQDTAVAAPAYSDTTTALRPGDIEPAALPVLEPDVRPGATAAPTASDDADARFAELIADLLCIHSRRTAQRAAAATTRPEPTTILAPPVTAPATIRSARAARHVRARRPPPRRRTGRSRRTAVPSLRRPPHLVAVVSVLLVALAAGLLVTYFSQSPRPPQPRTTTAVLAARPAQPTPEVTSSAVATPRVIGGEQIDPASVLAPSDPVGIEVPAIGVNSGMVDLGLNPDGTLQVPTSYHIAGWYDLGPTPGSVGPSVIVGHVDSVAGPGVFFRLGAMTAGQLINVRLADGVVAFSP